MFAIGRLVRTYLMSDIGVLVLEARCLPDVVFADTLDVRRYRYGSTWVFLDPRVQHCL